MKTIRTRQGNLALVLPAGVTRADLHSTQATILRLLELAMYHPSFADVFTDEDIHNSFAIAKVL